jgi:hypothetical protein
MFLGVEFSPTLVLQHYTYTPTSTCTDIPQPQSIITTKHDVIARFIHVIKPLGDIYKLPSTSLHIFYDQGGDMIAFNRNASIFLNLRYYEAWRGLSPSLHSVRRLTYMLYR